MPTPSEPIAYEPPPREIREVEFAFRLYWTWRLFGDIEALQAVAYEFDPHAGHKQRPTARQLLLHDGILTIGAKEKELRSEMTPRGWLLVKLRLAPCELRTCEEIAPDDVQQEALRDGKRPLKIHWAGPNRSVAHVSRAMVTRKVTFYDGLSFREMQRRGHGDNHVLSRDYKLALEAAVKVFYEKVG